MAFKFICFVFMECNNWNIKDNKDKKCINKLLITYRKKHKYNQNVHIFS